MYKKVTRSFSFVNQCLEHGNDEVINIIQVSFIEAIDEYLDDSIEVGKILNEAGVKYLEKWRKFLKGK